MIIYVKTDIPGTVLSLLGRRGQLLGVPARRVKETPLSITQGPPPCAMTHRGSAHFDWISVPVRHSRTPVLHPAVEGAMRVGTGSAYARMSQRGGAGSCLKRLLVASYNQRNVTWRSSPGSRTSASLSR